MFAGPPRMKASPMIGRTEARFDEVRARGTARADDEGLKRRGNRLDSRYEAKMPIPRRNDHERT